MPTIGRVSGLVDVLDRAAGVYRTMLAGGQGNVTADLGERAVGQAKSARKTKQFVEDAPLDLEGGLATGNSPARFDEFLAGIRGGESPTLHVLHMLMPHVPYGYLPNGLRYPEQNSDLGRNADDWVDAPWPPALANERMVLVTADHGIAFDPGQPIRGLEDPTIPSAGLVEDMWQPLFVKRPGQQTGGVSDANVMLIDLVPTIADALKITMPWKVDGVPAGTRPATDTDKLFATSTVNPFGVEIGPTMDIDGVAGLAAMLARNLDAIAPPVASPDPLQLHRFGDRGQLVGMPLEAVRVGGDSPARVTLDDAGAFDAIDLAGGQVPALVTGTATRSGTVVLAVNGVIAGSSPPFEDAGIARRFAVMVPPQLMTQGADEVAFFMLDPG